MTKKEDLIKKFKEKYNRNPPELSLQQINLLNEAFTNCANDREAYVYAGVCKSNFYYWQEVNPEFIEQKSKLRDLIKYRARKNIINSVREGSPSESKWILERWNKEEFSLRIENTGKNGKDLTPDVIIIDDIRRKDDPYKQRLEATTPHHTNKN